jgi:HEAT repeat protein
MSVLQELAEEDISARRELRKLVSDDDIMVRLHAAEAMWRLDGDATTVVPILRDGLRNDDPHIRRQAALTAGQLGAKAVELLSLLKDEFRRTKDVDEFKATEPLCRVAPHAPTVLAEMLADREAASRAIVCLQRLGFGAASATARMLKHSDAEVRGKAIIVLTFLHRVPQEVEAALYEALHDEEPMVALSAAECLWRVKKESRASLPLLRKSLTAPLLQQRSLAALTLADMREAAVDALPELRRALNDSNPHTRYAVVEALAACGGSRPEVAADLLTRLGREHHETVIEAIVERLGEMAFRDVETVAIAHTLIEIAKLGPPPARGKAATALGHITGQEALTVPALLEMRTDKDEAVVQRVVSAVMTLPVRTEPILRQGLMHPRAEVRLLTAKAIGGFGKDAAGSVPLLTHLLDDTDPDVRMEALKRLKEIGPAAQSAAKRVRDLVLQDRDGVVRRLAIMTLGGLQLRDRETKAVLFAALADQKEPLGSYAAEALSALKDDEDVLQELAAAVGDPHGGVGQSAAQVLARSGPNGRRFLEKLLRSEREGVVEDVLHGLEEVRLHAKDSVPALMAFLKEAKPELHGRLVTTLSLIGADGEPMRPILEKMVTSDLRAENRSQAATALARLGLSKSMDLLRERIEREDDEEVRHSLAEALLELRHRKEKVSGTY